MYLERKARFLRRRGLAMNGRTMHPGGLLSSADIFAVLYYHVLHLDPRNPDWADRDYFINARGFAYEPISVALAELGFFPEEDLDHAEQWGSHLHGLSATTTPGVELSCGSLGHGLPLGVGTALGLRALARPGRVFVVTGDGELQEGANWEAAMAASHYRLDRLTVVVDRNRYQSNDRGTETVMALEPLDDKFRAFGFATRRIDGHDVGLLVEAFAALPFEPGRPSAIVADTIKGKGVSFLEQGHVHNTHFGRDRPVEMLQQALQELEEPADA